MAIGIYIGIVIYGMLTGLTGWGGVIPASSPELVPLWYLRDLMVVVFFTPLLYFIFKYTKVFGLIVLSLCYIMGLSIGVNGFSNCAFLFFGAGGFFCINKIDITQLLYEYRYFIYGLTFALWIACTMYNGHNTKTGDYIYPFYVIFGSVAVLLMASSIVKNDYISMPSFLSRSSFFIYLVHTILIIKISRRIVGTMMIGDNSFLMFMGYLLVPLLAILLSLGLYYLISKYLPNVCGILTGER